MASKQLHFFGIKINNEDDKRKEGLIIPVDTTVFFAVILILLFIIAFSWGVERGRALSIRDFAASQKSLASPKLLAALPDTDRLDQELSQNPDLVELNPQSETKKRKPEVEADFKETEPLRKIDQPESSPVTSGYRIQVASFRTERSAREEASRLENTGLPVVIEQSGNYSVVYVGNFPSEAKAKTVLDELKTTYHDCILRKLN